MKNWTILFFVICVFCGNSAFANVVFKATAISRMLIITGEVKKFSRNTIEILDEQDKFLKRFVILSDVEHFNIGDRVRIWYNPGRRLIENIFKMTPVEYEDDIGQNHGYLLKSKQ